MLRPGDAAGGGGDHRGTLGPTSPSPVGPAAGPHKVAAGAHKEYRLKALQQIRNSLMPFAHDQDVGGRGRRSSDQMSSASSTASESSSYASLPSHTSSEDPGYRSTKRPPKIMEFGQDKEPHLNGLSKSGGKLKALRKNSFALDGVPLWERSMLDVGTSSRSDSPASVTITGLQQRSLLPDQPRLLTPDFPPSEPPPPPPPPRGPAMAHTVSMLKQAPRVPSSTSGHSSNSSKNPSPVPFNGNRLQGLGSYQSVVAPPPYLASLSSYTASSSSGGRQSPANTISSSEYSVPPMTQKRTPPAAYTPPPSHSPQPPGAVPPRPSPLQAWSARQAKSQSPVIMQSVKSTQVQKPILQTAIAPTSPPPVPQTAYSFSSSAQAPPRPVEPPPYPNQVPPPSYSVSGMHQQQQPQQQHSYPNVSPQHPPPYASALHLHQNGGNMTTVHQHQRQEVPVTAGFTTLPPPPYAASLQTRQEVVPTTVPTTEPPSYASSVVALAAQRAAAVLGKQQQTSISNSTTVPPTGLQQASHNRVTTTTASSDLVTTVASICSSQVSALQGTNAAPPAPRNNLNGNRKPSPIVTDTASSASRSESPVSFMSTTSASSPSTQSDSTHDSGRGKTTHQSPIPVRKEWAKEKEEERGSSKVRNYSSAAYKFFMEQHVENVLKSHQQRQRRREQLEAEMAKVGLSEEAQRQIRCMLYQKESNYIRRCRAKMDKSMFTRIKTIGVGAFGEVALVRKEDTNQLFAMKTLSKEDVLKRKQVAHVKAERDILAEADNEWVVKLYYSFQDKDNLYFVMDYIPGGDLMSLLIKFGVFQEPLARFYVAELVLAVESVHKLGFIHRDIKPDNVLIDRNGHIKLTDFGLCTGFRWTHNSKYYQRNGEHARQDSMDPDRTWSTECHCNNGNSKPLERRRKKEHQRCLAQSLVGTPNYIAPEVLARQGYGQSCDWWSVGVILYEMLVGQPPFLASTPSETQYKVLNWEATLQIPKNAKLSPEGTDLILKLCCGADRRLGRNGAEEIKSHGFFVPIDFSGDLRKQTAPYTPNIRYPADTSNFDAVDEAALALERAEAAASAPNDPGRHPEHAFFEFTFRRFFDDGAQAYPVRAGTGSALGVPGNIAEAGTEEAGDGQGSPVYV